MIKTCIENEEDRQKALNGLQSKSPDKFFKDCFQKVFPNLEFNKYFGILDIQYLQEDNSALISFYVSNMDETNTNNDDVLPTGNVENNH